MCDAPVRRSLYAGIVGNGRTCALIDARGRIGWLCLPTFAQFPVFASLLDPKRGGCMELGLHLNEGIFWASDYGYFKQRYLTHSTILETIWMIAGYTLTITDAMPWGKNTLVREAVVTGPATMTAPTLLARLRPTAPTPPSTRFQVDHEGIAIAETRCRAEGRLACRAQVGEQIAQHVDGNELILEFAPVQGKVTLVIAYQDSQLPVMASTCTASGANRPRNDERADEAWLADAVRVTLPDPDLEAAFERGLLTLRRLTYEPTGASLAAATASLPSEPGGAHNWDYRFCWVRDGCYVAQAFDLAGCPHEAERLYEFLLAREANGHWSSPLWAIESDYPTTEEQVVGLSGPGGETPVRIGNDAALQDQHDSPGNVLSGIYQHCLLTGATDLAARHWTRLARAVDWCCEHWAEAEAGIWERRERNRFWVHGRALCWVALRDGIRLARLLDKPVPPRWETTLAEIPRALLETAWSEEKGAFLRACGEPSIPKELAVYDVSTLALLLDGVIAPADWRMRQTVEKLAAVMAYGSAFRRDEEDVRYPFYLGTFWMIRAFLSIGEYDRAYRHLRAALDGTTDLGLMAEYFDPLTSRQFGNFPQAFSHEELVKTVSAMLWAFDGTRLVLFPAIPDAWLSPGNILQVANVPLGKSRGTIALIVEDACLRFAAQTIGECTVVIPSRYYALGKQVEFSDNSPK